MTILLKCANLKRIASLYAKNQTVPTPVETLFLLIANVRAGNYSRSAKVKRLLPAAIVMYCLPSTW